MSVDLPEQEWVDKVIAYLNNEHAIEHGYIYWKKKYYIAQVDIKSGKKKIIAEGVSDDKIIYTKGILRYVDADGNTKISECR